MSFMEMVVHHYIIIYKEVFYHEKVLVVIDMQNDFISGVLGNPECSGVVLKVVDIIKTGNYDKVYLTRDTHNEDYLRTQKGKILPVKHCIEDTEGWQIRPEITEAVYNNYASTDVNIIDKHSFGSLYLANLFKKEYFIEQENVEITFVGVCTGICVISNAMLLKAALPEAKIVVKANACACVTPDSHKTALEAMKLCQINIEEG